MSRPQNPHKLEAEILARHLEDIIETHYPHWSVIVIAEISAIKSKISQYGYITRTLVDWDKQTGKLKSVRVDIIEMIENK